MELLELTEEQKEWIEELEEMGPQGVNRVQKAMYLVRGTEELLRIRGLKLEKENDQLKIHIEAKDKAYMSLLTDYNYLQARIKRMEKAFLEYVENHKKLEDELDDVIMNR